MQGRELIQAASAAYYGRQAVSLPAWLVGEMLAAAVGGEPFPFTKPNMLLIAAWRCDRGQPLDDLPLTRRQVRIARGIAKAWQASQKNNLAA
ncbi:hypothetical protein JD523_20105 [Aeromonas enteropelogenes]|uniref:hypothetical protein n=1 Tax=Aeromonas enteropelogenes TaxID=29489 RepID=UPI00191D0567|nr:hypothetical protein [Aeromonas enteropelogenes]MBL0523163.1 hypothetical protein [Aeromonas enteropelogenes]